jgi:hypothetical protein
VLEASHARHQDTFSKVMDATLPRAAERDHDLGRSLEAALPHEPVEYTLTGAWDRLGAAWLVQRCTHAIRLGAPLYNAGAIYECTELYRTTIIECMRHPHNVPEAVQRIFYEVLGRHSLISASRRAWDFRSALDHAISIATAVCSPPQTRMVSPASIMHVPAVAPSDARDAHGWDPTSRIQARRRPHSSSSTAASSCSDASSPCNSRLISMPCDVLPLMLRHLCACELSALARTCTTLRGSSYAMAAEAVCASQPALRRGVRARTGRTGYVEIGATGGGGGAGAGSGTISDTISDTISGTAPEPSWVRTLHAIETVETYVGPRPVGRSWWDEWPALRRAESSSTTAEAIDDAAFGRGGSHSIKVLLSQHAASLSRARRRPSGVPSGIARPPSLPQYTLSLTRCANVHGSSNPLRLRPTLPSKARLGSQRPTRSGWSYSTRAWRSAIGSSHARRSRPPSTQRACPIRLTEVRYIAS